jgi:hypothetical protein
MDDESEYQEQISEKTVGFMAPLVILSIVLGVVLVAKAF